MKKSFRASAATILAFASAGCAHTPEAYYTSYAEPQAVGGTPAADGLADGTAFSKGPIKFRLAGSLLVVAEREPPKAADADKPANAPPPTAAVASRAFLDSLHKESEPVSDLKGFDGLKAQMTVVKAAAGGPLHGLVADDPFYYRSNLSPQYVPGTQVLSSLGTAAEDNSVAIVTAVGTIATAAISLGAFGFTGALHEEVAKPRPPATTGPKPLRLPFVIDITDGVDGSKCSDTVAPPAPAWRPLPGSDWSYRIDASPLPDTMRCAKFFALANSKGSDFARLFPVSACRDVTVWIRPKPAASQPDEAPSEDIARPFHVTVADPSVVEGFRIPSKGSISMPDPCGANLTVNPSGAPNDIDVVAAIANQAIAIKKARAAGH